MSRSGVWTLPWRQCEHRSQRVTSRTGPWTTHMLCNYFLSYLQDGSSSPPFPVCTWGGIPLLTKSSWPVASLTNGIKWKWSYDRSQANLQENWKFPLLITHAQNEHLRNLTILKLPCWKEVQAGHTKKPCREKIIPDRAAVLQAQHQIRGESHLGHTNPSKSHRSPGQLALVVLLQPSLPEAPDTETMAFLLCLAGFLTQKPMGIIKWMWVYALSFKVVCYLQ